MEPLVHPMAALAGAAEAHRSTLSRMPGRVNIPYLQSVALPLPQRPKTPFQQIQTLGAIASCFESTLPTVTRASGLPPPEIWMRFTSWWLVWHFAWVPYRSTPSLYPGSQRRSELGSDLGLICR